MKFDSLVIRLLDWINRFLGFQEKKLPKKPYESIKSFSFDKGKLNLIIGRDSPTAIRTWQFVPKRQILDVVYVCLDSIIDTRYKHLKRSNAKTHRVQIIKCSRYLNVQGYYNSSDIFSEDFDFIGSTNPRDSDLIARTVIDLVVLNFKFREVHDINWYYEIEKLRCEQLGLPKPNPREFEKWMIIL